jgi:hypothetical protein
MSSQARPTYAWWIILCLVGLDYFSSLAYLPSIATTFAEDVRDLAPLAGVGVVLVTLLGALPVYWYVVARSPHGKGGVGLLERRAHGWGGKLLLLVMLGFIATDFVLTRTLSVSDASTHILRNPYYIQLGLTRESFAHWFTGDWGQAFLHFWTDQLALTVLLSIGAFGLYHFLVQSLSRGFISIAVGIVGLYLLVNVVVISSGLLYLQDHSSLVTEWQRRLLDQVGESRLDRGAIGILLLLALKLFPPMAIGLSGFELTMAAAPSVRGAETDTPDHPAGRIWRTRALMVVVAIVMCMLVLSANFVVALLVDPVSLLGPDGNIEHRALSYLAHGGQLADKALGVNVNSMFGPFFGSIYDLSTVMILCLAGAGATISMRDIVPDFLSRFGMQLSWAHRIGVITHLFNGVILLVTVAFKASVTAQLWAYATSVLALLFGASLAALLDVGHRWKGNPLGIVARLPFLLTTLLFLGMGILIVAQQPVGVSIALLFVLVVLLTAIVSRWLRSTEMRFEGFEFHDEPSRQRWEEVCKLEFQVLVPHDPTHVTLDRKEVEIRSRHRIDQHIPIIFIEVAIGDPSDFFQKPVLQMVADDESREIIRVSRATSIAHVIAAIGLAFREVGHPPEFYFKWSSQSPMEATANFLLLGQGNIPFLVRALIHKAEPDPTRRPRVIVADS